MHYRYCLISKGFFFSPANTQVMLQIPMHTLTIYRLEMGAGNDARG